MNRFVSFAALAVGAGAFLALRRQSRRQQWSSAGQSGAAPTQAWEGQTDTLRSGSLQAESDPFGLPSDPLSATRDPQRQQSGLGEPLFTSAETRSGESLYTTDKPRSSSDPTL